jgi:hypothetical protein
MNVKETTPERLTIESRPWLLGAVLIVVIVMLAGIALFMLSENAWVSLGLGGAAALIAVMFVIFVRRVLVIFDRAAGAVVIRTATLLGQKEQSLPLADVRHARVESFRSTSPSGGRSSTRTTHRPVLETTKGPVPLTLISTSGNGAETVAIAINRWLAPQA